MNDERFNYASAAEFHAVWGDTDPCYNKLIDWSVRSGPRPEVELVVLQPRREVRAVIRIYGALSPMTQDWINDMLEWSK
jgi:hypothetical protein